MAVSVMIYMSGKRTQACQKAERFFKERRVPITWVDLTRHRLGARELELFARSRGVQALVDRSTPAALERPVAHLNNDSMIMDELLAHPEYMLSPIVRCGQKTTLGVDEAAWRAWLEADKP